MMTIAMAAQRAPNTSFTRLSSTMDTTAGRQIIGAANCGKLAYGAGESASNGGTNMGTVGIVTVIGTITTIRTRSGLLRQDYSADISRGCF